MMRRLYLNYLCVLGLTACVFAVASCNHQPSSREPQRQSTPANSSVTPKAVPASYDFTALDRILERSAPGLGGCALVLIQDDRIIYRKSFGRHEADRVVPIASASKWLSGALIMTLVDEGKLSLDDKISKYIPEFADDKSEITIRHLFAHTSGLPPEASCRNDKRTTLERCVGEMTRLKLRSLPGKEFYYGGVSMHIGGRIAEIVSGKSWNELFVDRLAVPLGMRRTDFFAYGPTSNPRPAGDARSSADDYGRFLQMILQQGTFEGKTILSAASVREMHKDQTAGARIAYTIYEKHAARDPELPLARYGVGVWREKAGDDSQLREASSQGALGFSPWIDLERQLAGVLSTQSSFSRVMPVYLELKNEIRRIISLPQK